MNSLETLILDEVRLRQLPHAAVGSILAADIAEAIRIHTRGMVRMGTSERLAYLRLCQSLITACAGEYTEGVADAAFAIGQAIQEELLAQAAP